MTQGITEAILQGYNYDKRKWVYSYRIFCRLKLTAIVLAGWVPAVFQKLHVHGCCWSCWSWGHQHLCGILVQAQDTTDAITYHIGFPSELAKNMSRVCDQVCHGMCCTLQAVLQVEREAPWLRKPVDKKAGVSSLWQVKWWPVNWLGKVVLDLLFLWSSWATCLQGEWRLCCSRQLTQIQVVPQQDQCCDPILLWTCALLPTTAGASTYFTGAMAHSAERKAMAALACRV